MSLTASEKEALRAARAVLESVRVPGFTLAIGTMSYDRDAGAFRATLTGTREGAIGKEGAAYNELRERYPMLPELGTTVASPRNGAMIVTGARRRKITLSAGEARYVCPLPAFIRTYCRPALEAMRPSERALFLTSLGR